MGGPIDERGPADSRSLVRDKGHHVPPFVLTGGQRAESQHFELAIVQ